MSIVNQPTQTLTQESKRRHFSLDSIEKSVLLERQLVGMAINSPQEGWLYINNKLCEMSGYSREEFLELTWQKLTHPKDLAVEAEQYERLLKGEIKEYMLEKRFFHKNKSIVHANLSVSCVYKEDYSIDYIVAIIEDITERKKAEEKINILNSQLQRHIEQRGAQLEEAVETLLKKEKALLNAQLQLQESQLKLTSIFSTIPDMVWLKDIYGFYLACNTAFEQHFGKSQSEIIGKTDYNFFPKEGADLCKQSDMDAIASNKITITKEELINSQDGTIGILEVRKTPIYKPNGELLGVLGIGRDITKNVQAKEQLLQEIEFSQGIINSIPDLLFEIAPDGTYLGVWTRDTHLLVAQREALLGKNIRDIFQDDALEVALKTLQEVESHGSSNGNSYTLELPDGKHLFELSATKMHSSGAYLVSARDITKREQAVHALKEKNAHYKAILNNSNDAIYLIEVTEDGRFIHLDINHACVEAIGMPKEAIVGRYVDELENKELRDILIEKYSSCLKAQTKTDYINAYNLHAQSRIYHSTLSPIFDENGRIYQIVGIARDITEQQEREELLRQKEEVSSALLNNLPGYVYTLKLSPEGEMNFSYLSAGAAEVYGFNTEDTLDDMVATIHKSVHPDDLPDLEAKIIQSSKELTHFLVRYRIYHPKEGEKWLEARSIPEKLQDGTIVWNGIVLDVTERKRQEELLQKKENEFRTLAENMEDNVARWDTKGRYMYINPTHERLLGMRLSEAISNSLPESHTQVWAALAKVVATKEKVMIRQEVIGERGEIEIHDVVLSPEFDENGEVVSVLGIGRDMTKIYRLQDEIAIKEKQFRTLVENLPDNILRYDMQCRATYISPQFARVVGDDVIMASLLGKRPIDAAINSEIVMGQYQNTLEEVIATGKSAEITIEVLTPQAQTQLHQIRFLAERDSNGEIYGALAIGTDITELTIEQENLQKIRAKLSAVISMIPDLIWVKNEDGVYLMCNPPFERFFGASKEEIIGKTDYDFLSKEQADFFRQKDKEAMEAGDMCINEEQIVFADNAQHAILETRKIPVYNGENFMGILGIGRDITKNMQAKELLLQKEKQFRTLVENIPDNIIRYDMQCRATYVSPQIARVVEDDVVATLLGKTPIEANASSASETKQYQNTLEEVIATGKSAEITIEVLTPQEEIQQHQIRFIAERDSNGEIYGALAIGTDITQRKQMDEKLLAKERELRTLIEQTPDEKCVTSDTNEK